MQRVCRSILCYVLCALLTASALPAQSTGGSGGAMLSGSGYVTVNGTSMGKSSAVFVGDKIQTGQSSAADLTAAGTTALIAANSSATYEARSIALNSGTIAVATSNAESTRAGRLLVKPVKSAAKYEVALMNCRTMVVAREGDLALSNGAYVKAGDSITETDADCADADAQNRKQGGAPPAPGVSAPGVSNRTLAYVAVGAGATAALIAILTTERNRKSPFKPKP